MTTGIVGDKNAEDRFVRIRLEIGGAGFFVRRYEELALDALDAANLATFDPNQIGLAARHGGGQTVIRTALKVLSCEGLCRNATEE